MTVIKDAVIVAAGLGGRMLPTSAYLAKESLPLVDIPAIIHLIREVINAGLEFTLLLHQVRILPVLGKQARPSHLNQKLVNRFF